MKQTSVIIIRLNSVLQKYHIYKWYQDDISLEEHMLVGPIHLKTSGKIIINTPTLLYVSIVRHWGNKEVKKNQH